MSVGIGKKFSKTNPSPHLPPSRPKIDLRTHAHICVHLSVSIFYVSIIYVHLSLHLPPNHFLSPISLSLPFSASPTHAYTKTNTYTNLASTTFSLRCFD